MTNKNIKILAIDAGTAKSGYCIMSIDTELTLYEFGKIENEDILKLINKSKIDQVVYENFQSYGKPIGKETIVAIEWNGRFLQKAMDENISVGSVFRKEEKQCLCGGILKAKDKDIRKSLIEKYAKFDFQKGKGTKNNPDTFYGVAADAWSAIAIGVTWNWKQNKKT